MDPRFQQSAFIPKTPATQSSIKRSAPINVFSLIATIVFIVSLGLGGAVFFLNRLELKKIAEKSQQLDVRNQELKADGTVPDLLRLDSRIQTAKEILNKHIALSAIFSLLEDSVSKNVRFDALDIAFKGDVGTLAIKGQGKTLNSVAFQSDVLRQRKNEFINPIFSGIDLDEKNNVNFAIDVSVDSKIPLYKNKEEFIDDSIATTTDTGAGAETEESADASSNFTN